MSRAGCGANSGCTDPDRATTQTRLVLDSGPRGKDAPGSAADTMSEKVMSFAAERVIVPGLTSGSFLAMTLAPPAVAIDPVGRAQRWVESRVACEEAGEEITEIAAATAVRRSRIPNAVHDDTRPRTGTAAVPSGPARKSL